MSYSLDDDLELLHAAARLAGEAAMPYFRAGQETSARVSYKDGNSPVSEADFAANTALEQHLRRPRPTYYWISEETVDAADRLTQSHVFVVDPIDGTRAFIAGKLEWSVSVALVVNGKPVAGVVHAPALGLTYRAREGGGAFCNGKLIACSAAKMLDEAMYAGPKSILEQLQRETGAVFRQHAAIPSLAYRMVLAAEGRVDLAVASTGAHDWDVAAADIILREAGAALLDLEGRELVYNRPSLRRGTLVAGPEPLAKAASKALEAAVGLRR
jgi:myo-inositol-1(or 4)-monophosphatase